MPIFSRRRIQSMLDDLRPLITENKVSSLLGGLRDKKKEQMIATEMELGLLWGINQVAQLQVDPALPNSSRVPDAYSEDLFDEPSYIEITTISDGKLSGEEAMQRAAQRILEYANTCRKNIGKYLHFSFDEKDHWEGSQYFREHRVAPDFELTDSMKSELKAWIDSVGFENSSVKVQDEGTGVTVKSTDFAHPVGFNYFSSLPSLAYDLESNPLFTALEEKNAQLAAVPSSALKVIFVADRGSRLLRRLSEKDPQRQYKSGEEIIGHFLRQRDIDLVCVFSTIDKQSRSFNRRDLRWKASYFCGRGGHVHSFDKLERLVHVLPAPRFAACQARSIQKQAGFAPTARGWYLGATIGPGREKITVRLSARLLQEYLAGRVTAERFDDEVTGRNLFEKWLSEGYLIRDAHFESAGIDKDDDHVILELRRDPAAAEFS
jgi:hypothetical protein